MRQEPIGLFIQDILRPDMNGFELYWRMKSEENLRDIPILILSAWPSVEMNPVELMGKTQECLHRVEFKGIEPEHLNSVAAIQDANVFYVEGYLFSGVAIPELLDTIEKILQECGKAKLTGEERKLRYEQLWSRAAQVFGDSPVST